MTSSGIEEDVYDVERIVASRVKDGKKQYLIKWVGYPENENTWELEENLMCEELLDEFKKKEAKKESNLTKKKEAATNVKQQSTKAATAESSIPENKNDSKRIAIANTDISKPLRNNSDFKKMEPSFSVDRSARLDISRPVTNDWDGYIKKVVGAFLNKDGRLEIEFILHDGTKCTSLSQDLKYKAPLKLIAFYEENLSFPE